MEMTFPARPGFGKVGRVITVAANHFKVKYNPPGDVYHYDVAFRDEQGRKMGTDGVPPRSVAEKIMRALDRAIKAKYPQCHLVSDLVKNIYAAQRLPFAEERFDGLDIGERVGRDNSPKLFSAVVKEADPVAVRMEQLSMFCQGQLNYTPYDALQALDVALRYTAAQRFTVVGRNLYSPVGATPLSGGVEAWSGYFQSLRPTQNHLVINLDLSTTAFVQEMDVIDFVANVINRDVPAYLERYQHADVSKAVRGIKVATNHRPGIKRSYRVNGLSPKSAEETIFEDENGKRFSVAQYFAANYRRLRYPGLPCLHVGAVNKKTYLPIEVCRIIPGQKCPRKINDRQTAEMIKVAATRPAERKSKIEGKVRDAHFDQDETLRAFGVQVDRNMVTARARVLPPPTVMCKGAVTPRDGVWNMRGMKFESPATVSSFAVINLDFRCQDQAVNAFFSTVISFMGNFGMIADGVKLRPPPVIRRTNQRTPLRDLFSQALDAAQHTYGKPAQIVWMIQSRQDSTTYGELKCLSDTEFGIVSQCMLSKHILKGDPQYVSNILLKVNTKLGGRNFVLQGPPAPVASRVPTIMFGADVTHPSPGDKTRPSIAALVGTLDAQFVRHASTIRVQGHRVEQIVYLRDMVVELLKAFYIHNQKRCKPEQIIFYRDGVSEGQFHMVLNHEVTAIREACRMLDPNYSPRITFVIVQKRHHTRLFPVDSRDGDSKGNLKAGTVVDNGVCHPTEHDFYLLSHAGIQGTSRPTHYHVLLDEIGFSADDIQMMTNRLCYTYARCPRSVSMVPSAYYSHLLAYRARFFTPSGADSASGSTASEQFSETDLRMFPVHPSLQRIQYYV
ncbi:hypothetical protein PINS_up001054 [Pythium insidiosum]|nr:hypothetical protein PINS_up001054 [Pythium insidiosum]